MIKRQNGKPEIEIQKEKEIFKGVYDLVIASSLNDGNLKSNITSYLKTQYNDPSKDADVELIIAQVTNTWWYNCLLYTSPSPRDGLLSRMPSSA